MAVSRTAPWAVLSHIALAVTPGAGAEGNS